MRCGAQGGDAVCKSLVSSDLRAALLKTVFYAAICRLLACVLRLSAMRFAVSWRAFYGFQQCVLPSLAKHPPADAVTARLQLPSGKFHLAAYPLHYHVHDVTLLRRRKPPPRRYAVPLGQASAATAARGVLRYEHGMAAHRRLPAIVRRRGGREAAAHKVLGVAAYLVHALSVDILNVSRPQPKTTAEGRP